MPLFFSSNIIFGRAAIDEVEPFTLAFLRWFLTALILFPFVAGALKQSRNQITALKLPLLAMGFFGMWVCGALVYLALSKTTATNGTLIYTSSPVMILLIEWWLRGRRIGAREAFGVVLAFAGVLFIVSKGKWTNVTGLQFNIGDLIFVGTAFSWAVYSVALKSDKLSSFQTMPLFTLIAASGALLLAPFAIMETLWLGSLPQGASAWTSIAGIVVIASLLAFSTFQYGVKVVGASTNGIYLYLLPVYGVSMAVLFLGEEFRVYHFWGIILVLSGVILATAQASLFRRN